MLHGDKYHNLWWASVHVATQVIQLNGASAQSVYGHALHIIAYCIVENEELLFTLTTCGVLLFCCSHTCTLDSVTMENTVL